MNPEKGSVLRVEPHGFFVDWELLDLKAPSHCLKILLVTPRAATRERIGDWLIAEGHEVIECPGPSAPDYHCLGGLGLECPLAKGSDLVVLDLNLASDAVGIGTPSWKLVDYYLETGHRVVAIAGPEQVDQFFLDDRVVTLDEPIDATTLIEAIDYLSKKPSIADAGAFRPQRRSTDAVASKRWVQKSIRDGEH